MNQYDSERMAESMLHAGYRLAHSAAEADIVILNTCHIREKATEKIYSELGRMRSASQRHGREQKIVVAGCTAQAEGTEMQKRAANIDLVLGPQCLHRLPQWLETLERTGAPCADTEFPDEDKFDFLPEERSQHDSVSAFLTIQEGCDRFCSFCVVPYTRGMESSRSAEAILREAQRLVGRGVRELTLLGQNVNNWCGQGTDGKLWGLGKLCAFLAEKLPDMQRLRYTTSHPAAFDSSLIRAHSEIPKLMPFVHLPVQSGSDRILAAMNRRHSVDEYLELIVSLRRARPDIAISSDFIVGFPGETDKDFLDTLRLVREVEFASAYAFRYSPRLGTPAARRDDQIPASLSAERLQTLQQLLDAQQEAFNARFENRIVDILVTGNGRQENQKIGRTPWMQTVHVELPSGYRFGSFASCLITGRTRHGLRAEYLKMAC